MTTSKAHIAILRRGVDVWNDWRNKNPGIRPELSGANLAGKDLSGANLRDAMMPGCFLKNVKLRGADLSRASLIHSVITFSDLSGAKLVRAYLGAANLYCSSLAGANLAGAMLDGASLVDTEVENARFTGCRIYGISAWDLRGQPKDQSKLLISWDPPVTVDDLEVAQFIYLLINNDKIRSVIDTVKSKVVLILGRFTRERKAVLDALRKALQKTEPAYVPVMFDFKKARSQPYIETVSMLAHMARFVIADVTEPKIVLEELPHIVRNIAVPVQPLLLEDSGEEPVTLHDLRRNQRSLLPTVTYKDILGLIEALETEVIRPAEALAATLGAD